MKSEIKFKFWLGHTQKMTYEHSLIDIAHIFWDFTEDIIPLQFTGLLDVDSNEICEGDIYSYDNTNAGYGDPNQPEKLVDTIRSIHDLFFNDEVENRLYSLKIIGNIYENPELLVNKI